MKLPHFIKNQRIIFALLALLLLFFMLGQRTIWSQETRWASIVHHMITSHHYLNPLLDGKNYYDKPLLSYWLTIIASYITGGLNIYALRLPSAIASLVTLWSTYQLGKYLFNKRTAMIAIWLLLSTFYFLFWSRVASANMLNLAGIMLALACYFRSRDQPTFLSYLLFFVILSLTSLCKGLLAPVVVAIAVLTDLLSQQRWRQHHYGKIALALLFALIIYLLPFILSAIYATPVHSNHRGNGLYQVFHENIIRYFHPFDNTNPIYTYLLYLPIYTLPWAPLLLLALIKLPRRWKNLSQNSRWLYQSSLVIFLFLTFSGSRRSYYVLPLVPLALLMTAEWLHSMNVEKKPNRIWYRSILTLSLLICSIVFFIIYPLANTNGDPPLLAKKIITQAEKHFPWSKWHLVMLTNDDKMIIYLNSANPINYHSNRITDWKTFTTTLNSDPKKTIIIIDKRDLAKLPKIPKNYLIVKTQNNLGDRLFNKKQSKGDVALIPQ